MGWVSLGSVGCKEVSNEQGSKRGMRRSQNVDLSDCFPLWILLRCGTEG